MLTCIYIYICCFTIFTVKSRGRQDVAVKQRSGALHRAPLSSQLLSSARKPGAPEVEVDHCSKMFKVYKSVVTCYIICYNL